MNNIKKTTPDKGKILQRTLSIAKPPKCLWYMGNLPDEAPTVAIVGSRKPTEYGRYVTHKLASQLAARGVIIVSGLAIGHDALAHSGALDGGGICIGVATNGLDNMYPKTTWQLRMEIINRGGLVISEHAPGTPVQKWNILARNRLVSALADVVIVVEAAARSGTLNTTMHALEQGKELMAVPGNITSPLSVGCNRLITQGATPVTSVDDVLEKLGLTAINEQSDQLPLVCEPNQQKIIEIIKSGIIDGDAVMANAKLSISEFNQALTMLEISGVVRSLGANRWILK